MPDERRERESVVQIFELPVTPLHFYPINLESWVVSFGARVHIPHSVGQEIEIQKAEVVTQSPKSYLVTEPRLESKETRIKSIIIVSSSPFLSIYYVLATVICTYIAINFLTRNTCKIGASYPHVFVRVS